MREAIHPVAVPPDHIPLPAAPHNLEAEQALLGVLMFDTGAFDRVPEPLRPEHFHEPFHQRIYEAIRALTIGGRLADPTLVADRVRSDPAFEAFGGLRYLADLVDRAPPAVHAAEYARSVMDLALRRELVNIGLDLAYGVEAPDKTAAEHLAQVEASLFALAEAGETERPIASFGEAMGEALEQAEAAYKRDGKLAGLSTHLIDLDNKLGGLHPSDLLILAGRPSMGKTALGTNIAFRAARAGAKVLFASLEMSRSQLVQRILSDVADVSADRIRKGQITDVEFARLREAEQELAGIPLSIDDTGGLHIARLCARARRYKRKHGLDLLVVDYLQLITTDHQKGGNRVQEVTQITVALKALAKELNVPIIALSQLSRQVESRDDKRPQLSDLRESGSIEQDADVVMFVYRESYYLARTEPKEGSPEWLTWREDMDRLEHQAEVIIGKQRHGPIGTVRLSFDADTTRFGNLAHEGRYEPPRGPRYSFGDAG